MAAAFLPGNCERLIIRVVRCFVRGIRFETNDQPVLVHNNPGNELCGRPRCPPRERGRLTRPSRSWFLHAGQA